MKYFVIYSDQKPQDLEDFNQNNQHLAIDILPISAPSSDPNLRDQLLKDKIITANNIYDATNLAFTKAHISLWKQAIETQSPITVFEANAVTHKDFLTHQEHSLSAHTDYDLMVWGYNLNWNPCLQLMPCLPNVIYTFTASCEEDFGKINNELIDAPLYQKSDLETIQTIKALSFASLGCYTLSVKGAKQLLEKATHIDKETAPSYQETPHGTNFYVFNPTPPRENISLDIEVNRHIEPLNVYLTVPMLAVLPTNTASEL